MKLKNIIIKLSKKIAFKKYQKECQKSYEEHVKECIKHHDEWMKSLSKVIIIKE